MKKPHSSVRYSVSAPGTRSCSEPSPGVSGIEPTAGDRVELAPLRLERELERAEQRFALRVVVGCQVADVDVDGDEAVLWPCVDREVRFGEQHRAGDALRFELVEAVA